MSYTIRTLFRHTLVATVIATAASDPLSAQSGVLVGHGENLYGELNAPIDSLERTPVQIGVGIKKILATSHQSYLVKASGQLLASGSNGWRIWSDTPGTATAFTGIATNIADLSGDYTHLLTVDTSGVLRGQGQNSSSALGHNAPAQILEPLTIDNEVKQVHGVSGASTLWLKTNGELWGMGLNFGNPLAIPGAGPAINPVLVASGVKEISGSGNTTFYLATDNSLWAVGINQWGQFGLGHRENQEQPTKIAEGVVHAQGYAGRTVFVKSDGTLWGMGYCENGELGPTAQHPQLTPTQIAPDARKVALGQYHTLYVDSSGRAWGFGRNSSGQLGLGDTVNRAQPTFIMDGVAEVSTGSSHSLFLKTDGTAWGAGLARVGLLGGDANGVTSIPQRSTSRVKKVSTSTYTTFFLKEDQTLWSVGSNWSHHLGLGTPVEYADSSNLVATDVIKFSTAGDYTLFIKKDQTLWIVGNRSNGRAGIVPAPQTIEPAQIATGAVEVAASNGTSFYIDQDGVLWGTGRNDTYQLGLGHKNEVYRFERIATNVASIATNGELSLFIENNGNLWGMGQSYYQALGFNSQVPTPQLIATHVTHAACGAANSYFLTEEGNLMGMGESSLGQLGQAEHPFWNPTPQLIAQNVVGFDGGNRHVVWIDKTGDLWGQGSANGGELGEPIMTSSHSTRRLAQQVIALAAGFRSTLYVQIPETYLTNLSTRVKIPDTGEGRLVAGFVIGGTEPLTALVRAIGPGLHQFGVDGTLANPTLEIFNSAGETIISNDNWSAGSAANTTELAAVSAELGAFGLAPGSADAALLVTLSPGAYTAQIVRGDGPGGVVLLEVYNRNPRSWRSRLVNLSVRTDAGSGADTLTAGFVVEGNRDQSLLMRAIGPGLADFGVTGFLADPQLALLKGTTSVASNDDWAGNSDVISHAADLGAFPLSATTSADAATVVSVAAGAYTTQVLTKGDATGNTLVEIYQIDN